MERTNNIIYAFANKMHTDYGKMYAKKGIDVIN